MAAMLSFPLEIKALTAREFQGHGAVFGNVDRQGDIVMPGAFKASLAEHKAAGEMPLMLWMHRPDEIPGVWLDMKEDNTGLYVRGQLADTQLGNEVRTLLNMKAVRGLSIGYAPIDFGYDRAGNRLLKQVDVWETSIVSRAANPLATVESVKARLSEAGEYIPTEREFEHSLRDAGYSKSVARHICAKVFDFESGGGMPLSARRWDAGTVDEDEAELLKALDGLTDRYGAAALSR